MGQVASAQISGQGSWRLSSSSQSWLPNEVPVKSLYTKAWLSFPGWQLGEGSGTLAGKAHLPSAEGIGGGTHPYRATESLLCHPLLAGCAGLAKQVTHPCRQ